MESLSAGIMEGGESYSLSISCGRKCDERRETTCKKDLPPDSYRRCLNYMVNHRVLGHKNAPKNVFFEAR